MRYGYYSGTETFTTVILVIAMIVIVVILGITVVAGINSDPVLSEELNRYEMDPTIVQIDSASCDLVVYENGPCMVTFVAPIDLVRNAQYIRLINPQAAIAVDDEAVDEEAAED